MLKQASMVGAGFKTVFSCMAVAPASQGRMFPFKPNLKDRIFSSFLSSLESE